jgi:hypothetical protein
VAVSEELQHPVTWYEFGNNFELFEWLEDEAAVWYTMAIYAIIGLSE